ncbi:hypothetical protein LNV23_07375 [Paucibacter sp. DJ1R-11]|uniref:hypothetical protein n=1 Tax=Paucibacter sp. DJ1R-11 TaxID=2893556 RepID=UPI0021E505DB|nr:hypothetical protein [Paucibacter sp. DJ1R-11]MCV2363272.1 hypothetical protein [Paucibacter sp. DJ1R-11]
MPQELFRFSKLRRALLAMSCVAAAAPAWAQTAVPAVPAGPAAQLPAVAAAPAASAARTVALISAIGDRITIVRQRPSVGSHMEPYTRREIKFDPRLLNRMVLSGLDQGLAQTEPDSQRVLLDWLPEGAEAAQIDDARRMQREARIEALLIEHLRAVPARQQWDEIIAVLPKWTMPSVKGMGEKLAGIGIYVQPLRRQALEDLGTGELSVSAITPDGDHVTLDPNTGEKEASSIFVAVYMYMQTLTLDAKTLEVKKRELRRDNIKYFDPKSPANDVGRMFDNRFLLGAVAQIAERSAQRAITGDVNVSPARKLAEPAAAAPGASSPR